MCGRVACRPFCSSLRQICRLLVRLLRLPALVADTDGFVGWLNTATQVMLAAMCGLILGEGALQPGQTVGAQVALALAWAFGILVIFAPLAVRQYRRTVG